MTAIVDAFRAALPADEAVDPTLEPALATAIARGAAAHPAIKVPPVQVAAYLGAHADEHRPPAEWLPQRNLPDLHLACAILHGVPAALAAFERDIVPILTAAADRIVRDPDLARDIAATVRDKLALGVAPRIADYGGHGDLATWARVIAVRAAIDQLRHDRRALPADDALWAAAAPTADPALATQKRESAALVKTAFHTALAALTPRQRNLLRQHLLDDLTIDELGPMYRVHRVTVARWLASARSELWAHTRRELRSRLAIDDAAIVAMLDDIRSTLDLSIERALAD